MLISDWSSDVCSSDLRRCRPRRRRGRETDTILFARARLKGGAMTAESQQVAAGADSAATLADTGHHGHAHQDRKSVVSGKSVSVRVDRGGRRILQKKKNKQNKLERKNTTRKRK